MQILAARSRAMQEREQIDVLQLSELGALLANAVQNVIDLMKQNKGKELRLVSILGPARLDSGLKMFEIDAFDS